MWALYWNITTLGRDLTDEELGYISYENALIGMVRFRQVRVRNQSCTVHPYFAAHIDSCIGYYTPDKEFTDDYGVNGR